MQTSSWANILGFPHLIFLDCLGISEFILHGADQWLDRLWGRWECLEHTGGWQHSRPQFWYLQPSFKQVKLYKTYPGILEQIKPLQLVGQAADLKSSAITPEGFSRRQSNYLTAKSIAKLLGQRSSTAWVGWTGKPKHRVFPSRRQ